MANQPPDNLAAPEQSRFWTWFGLVALLLYGGLFIYVALRHILYPGFTEPMEGNALQHIERAARGLPLYPQPSGDFVALAYLPFYYFAAVPFYEFFGDSLAGPRLLSTISALGAGALVWLIARRESGERPTAHLAAAFFFAAYRVMDSYLICALPDSFMLFWVMLGWYFLGYGRRWQDDAIWLAAFTLAFWTKQQGAFFFGAAMLYALFFRPAPGPDENRLRRELLLTGFILGGPCAYLAIGPALGERFFFYTFALPGSWPHSVVGAIARTAFILLCGAPFAALLAISYLKPWRRPARGRRLLKLRHPVAFFTLSSLLVTTFTMTSTGSSNNHYIPFLTGLAIAAALGARQILAGEFPARIKPLLAFVCLTATVAASLALWLYKDHNIPFFLPLAFIAVWLAYLRAARYEWTPRGHYELLAGVLAVGQFIVSFYYLPDYLPDAGYRANITELRAELLKLDAPVIWADYGNAPQALTGCKLTAAPSWVSLEDMTRQQVAPEIVAADIAPVMARWRHYDKLYILTNQPLEGLPGWKLAAWEFELERDYKKEFAAVREIALHWYSGGGYPRYLYRLRRPHSSSNASYYVQTRPTP